MTLVELYNLLRQKSDEDIFEERVKELQEEAKKEELRRYWNNAIVMACGGEKVMQRRMLHRRARRAFRR